MPIPIEPHWINRQQAAVLCGMSAPSFDKLIRPYLTAYHGAKSPDGKKIGWTRYCRLDCLAVAERYWNCSKRPAQPIEESIWDVNVDTRFSRNEKTVSIGSIKRSELEKRKSRYASARENVISTVLKKSA